MEAQLCKVPSYFMRRGCELCDDILSVQIQDCCDGRASCYEKDRRNGEGGFRAGKEMPLTAEVISVEKECSPDILPAPDRFGVDQFQDRPFVAACFGRRDSIWLHVGQTKQWRQAIALQGKY